MKDYPLISIITTTYKKFDMLEETVSSALVQDYPRIEYIITDDGSENFNMEELNRVINTHRGSNLENVVIIHHEKNLGTVKNVNSAWKAVKGKYIIPLAMDDVFVNENVVSKIVNRMEETNSDVLAYTRILITNDNQKLRRMPCSEYYKFINKLNTPRKQYLALITGNFYEMASGSAICTRRSILDTIGFLDESYTYWEDGPFIAKCNKSGIIINTAYDIDGIFYRVGGISDVTTKSIASLRLQKDAIRFYENELYNNHFKKNFFDKRQLAYSIRFGQLNDKKGIFKLRISYFDVALYRYLKSIKCKKLLLRESKNLYL